MVTRTSHLVPELSEAFFRCSVCKSEANVEVQRGRIAEPTLCPNCNTGHSYALVHNRCQFQASVDELKLGCNNNIKINMHLWSKIYRTSR